jgi:hypothetical protein
MKILLDENIPTKLIFNFGKEYEVKSVRDMGWQGKKNGELLGLLTFNGFDFFITLDKNLRHQQNLEKFDVKIILLLPKDNKHQTLQPLVDRILNLLKAGNPKKFIEIGL